MRSRGCSTVRFLVPLLLLAVLSVSPRHASGQGYATPLFNPANGHWYQPVASGPLTWHAARDAAMARFHAGYRGHLATITSEAENRFIQANVPGAGQHAEWWIGGYQDRQAFDYREPGGGWRWVTGEPFGYTDWSSPPGEPNNAHGNEDALVFRGRSGWNDMGYGDTRSIYLVEYSPPARAGEPRIGILPNPATGGQVTAGLLSMVRDATGWETSVMLVSSDPTVAVVPASVVVPSGSNQAVFWISTYPVARPTEVTLYAIGPGSNSEATLLVLPAAPPLADGYRPNLLQNGAFEEPPIPMGQPHRILAPWELPGWRVATGGAVLVAPYRWQPAPGGSGQMLHLLNPLVSPPGLEGSIEQPFVTEPGRRYTFTGWFTHNPYRAEGRVQVSVNGEPQGDLWHSVALFGPSNAAEMRWQPFLFSFRARGPVTSLQLTDVTRSPYAEGAVLDGLAARPAEESIWSPAPVAPSGLAVRLITGTQIELAWSDNSFDESGFEIERREDPGVWRRIALLVASTRRFSDFDLRPATTYVYRVRAVNDRGASLWSNEAVVGTLAVP